MNVMAWLWIGLSILGAIILAVVVWLAGPLVSIGDVQPFDSVLVRSIIVALILLAVAGAIAWRILSRRRAAAKIAAGDDRDGRRRQRRAGPEAEDGGRSRGPQTHGQVERARPL